MSEHESHGHSVAAWTLVGLVSLGSVLIGIAFAVWSLSLGIVGAIIIVVGLIAGKALAVAGKGAKPYVAPARVETL